ncbi:hypothetical protein V6615_04180 [Oscillospiraceae bacterium PP1C4]
MENKKNNKNTNKASNKNSHNGLTNEAYNGMGNCSSSISTKKTNIGKSSGNSKTDKGNHTDSTY